MSQRSKNTNIDKSSEAFRAAFNSSQGGTSVQGTPGVSQPRAPPPPRGGAASSSTPLGSGQTSAPPPPRGGAAQSAAPAGDTQNVEESPREEVEQGAGTVPMPRPPEDNGQSNHGQGEEARAELALSASGMHDLPPKLASKFRAGTLPEEMAELLSYLDLRLAKLEEAKSQDVHQLSARIERVRLQIPRPDDLQQLQQSVEHASRTAIGAESTVGAQGQEIQGLSEKIEQLSREMQVLTAQLNNIIPNLSPQEATMPARPTTDGAQSSVQVLGVTATNAQAPTVTHPVASVPPVASAPQVNPVPQAAPVAQVHPVSHVSPLSTAFPSLNATGMPEPAVVDDAMDEPTYRLGPTALGVEPHQTMVDQFKDAVDYRHYRLNDMSPVPLIDELTGMYKTKRGIDSLDSTIGQFDGSDPITLLPFLAKLKNAINGVGKSEALGVSLLSFFLAKDAHIAYVSHMSPGARVSNLRSRMPWPAVVNMLITTFLTEDVL